LKNDIVAKVRYSQVAIGDLEQISDYIAEELKNPTAAFNTINRIQDAIDNLSHAPRIGAPLSVRYMSAKDYRFLVCKSYMVFYREKGDEVYIDRILYGKRDYLRILFGSLSEENE
jgi:plasmid stabilization system protein ParE